MQISVNALLITMLSFLGLGEFTQFALAQSPALSHQEDSIDKEDTENDLLQRFATITLDQARQAAEAMMGRLADRIELENDDGNLVYAVSFGDQDVKIDAGNGTVLYTDNRQGANQKAIYPRSSIQVSGTDADGETNDDG